jgi:hypothetical protein
LRVIVDESAPKAQIKDANRKHDDRIELRDWLDRVDEWIAGPSRRTHLDILDRSERKVRFIRTDTILTPNP